MKKTLLFNLLALLLLFSCRENIANENTYESNSFKIQKNINNAIVNNITKFAKENSILTNRNSEFNLENFQNDNLALITFPNQDVTAYVARQNSYNESAEINYAVCYLVTNENEISDYFFIETNRVLNGFRTIRYYDNNGNLQILCDYNNTTGYLSFPGGLNSGFSDKINWKGVKSCVSGIYDMGSGYGVGLTVISAFIPETFAAIVAGCILKNS